MREAHYISGAPYRRRSLSIQAKIRYSARPVLASLMPIDQGRVKLAFDEPVRAITPGQAVVFYQGENVLGGAIIEGSPRYSFAEFEKKMVDFHDKRLTDESLRAILISERMYPLFACTYQSRRSVYVYTRTVCFRI